MGTGFFSELHPAKDVALSDYLFELFLNVLLKKKKEKKIPPFMLS